MSHVEITEQIKYIGADDKTLDLFESQYLIPNGVSYNSYLILDEKIAVMDTVDMRATGEWLRNMDRELQGKEPDFLPPVSFASGSEFRQEVWKILLSIPYGKTMTYGEIAACIAKKRGLTRMSAQAVGGAVGHNPISIIVPCHRVVGTDGSLTGYAGGIDKKIKLLEYEHMDVEQFYVPKKGTICKNKTIG